MMKIGRAVSIFLLAVLCLSMIMFALPSRSSVDDYDPWADINDDGKINMYDIGYAARLFGTSGDSTKNVNVTNPSAMTLQNDLNISVSQHDWFGYGENTTDLFATRGFDRMFVSAAIIGISNQSAGYYVANLTAVHWIWGTIDNNSLETESPIYPNPDPNNVLAVEYYGGQLPVSSQKFAEFAIKADQCRLSLEAESSFLSGWVLVRVSIYLTDGTNSPPTVQNTYVTNMPNMQPQPSWQSYALWFNLSFTSGNGFGYKSLGVGGYSRMFVSITLLDASYHGVPITTQVSLYIARWGAYGDEATQTNLDATYDGFSMPWYSHQVPSEFKIKDNNCQLWFTVSSGVPSGWIAFYANVYLRNE